MMDVQKYERAKSRLVLITTVLSAGGILLLGFFLRLSHYTSKAMWWDEVLVLITVKDRSFIDIISQLSHSLHTPVYYLLVKVMSMLSRSDAVLKLPSLACGVLTVPVLFHVTAKLCDRKTAAVAAYLLSVAAIHVKYSQMLRMYTMVTLFSLLATYMLYRLLQSRGRTWYVCGYAVFTALAVNTHILSLAVVCCHIAFVVYCLAGRAAPEFSLDSFVIRRFALSLLIAAVLCASVFHSFFAIAAASPGKAPMDFLRESPGQLAERFQLSFAGPAPGRIFGISRSLVFSAILFPAGILFALLSRKRWAVLFALHGISLYVFMLAVGYDRNSGGLSTRHLLLTLPPLIMFVSIGLTHSAGFIFSVVSGGARFRKAMCGDYAGREIFSWLRGAFVISFAALVLIKDAPAAFGSVRMWYAESREDWRTCGEYVNRHMRPGILAFFADQCFQHHLAAYVDRDVERLLFHPANTSRRKRTIWAVASCIDPGRGQVESGKLEALGFELKMDSFRCARIYEKEVAVRPLITISGPVTEPWVYSDDYESYKFVADSFAVRNLTHRYSSLRPAVSDEPCSIVYQFMSGRSADLKSFRIKFNSHTGEGARVRVSFSADGKNFEECMRSEKPGSYSLDISERAARLMLFYVEFELFSRRLPADFVDSLEKACINDIQFEADFRN